MKAFLLPPSLIITGCVSMKTNVAMLKHGGHLKIEEVKGKDFNYFAYVRNVRDFGWNGNNPDDRRAAVFEELKDRCQNPKVLDELGAQSGVGPFNSPHITWIMRVKC